MTRVVSYTMDVRSKTAMMSDQITNHLIIIKELKIWPKWMKLSASYQDMVP